jgi:hypothetical protein
MKLVWESLNFGNPNAPWTLWLMDGLRFVDRLGGLRKLADGYAVYHHPQLDPYYPLPNDLTLDEAKSAAKLILAAGRQS